MYQAVTGNHNARIGALPDSCWEPIEGAESDGDSGPEDGDGVVVGGD